MGVLEDLKARRATVASTLASMTIFTVGGKPNAMTADGGTSVDHVAFRKSLLEELKLLDEAILREADVQAALDDEDGSWEIESQVYS
jgi:hypothetical protein